MILTELVPEITSDTRFCLVADIVLDQVALSPSGVIGLQVMSTTVLAGKNRSY